MTRFTLYLNAAIWPIVWVLFVLVPFGFVMWPILIVVPAALAVAVAVSACWLLVLALFGTLRVLALTAGTVHGGVVFAAGRAGPLLRVVGGGAAGGRAAVSGPRPGPVAPVGLDAAWSEAGFGAKEARKWQRCNFAPEAARAWSNTGFGPVAARAWRGQGFTAGRARSWRARGLTPRAALEWTAGVSPLAVT